MKDEHKTKEQLINELVELRQRIAELEVTEAARQRAEEALKLKMDQLAALSQASQAVTASLELDQVLAEIVSLAGEVLTSDYTSVMLVDEAGHIGRSAENLPGVPTIEYRTRDDGLTSWIVRSRQVVIIDEIGEEGSIHPDLGAEAPRTANPHIVEAGVKSVAGLPLVAKNRLLGVLYLHSLHSAAFRGQLPLLTTFANQVAIAIENARLYEAVRQELAERKRAEEALRRERDLAKALEEAAAIVSSTLDPDQVLDRILEQVSRVVPNDAVNIMLVEGDQARIARWRGYERFGAEKFVSTVAFRIPKVANLQQVMESREPMVIPDTATYPGWIHVPGQEWLRSYAAAPIIARDEVIGFLNVDSATPGFFTQTHAEALRAFASHAAAAIENARLYESERRRSAELEALHQASLHLTSTLELQPVLETILDYALKLVSADDAHIFLYDGERLTFGAALWANVQQPKSYAEPRPQGLTYTVARSGERIVISDVDNHPLFRDWQWGGAIVGLPLRVGERVVGVMNVAFLRPHAFDENELRVLGLLADQAAIAIENARLHEAVRQELAERKRLEAQLLHSQKLEAVGRLAGGVAHDFNNLLTAIIGYSDLVLMSLGQNDPLYKDVEEIKKAAERAASLTRQLLAFSRKQMLQPKVLNLNATVAHMEKMLQRLIRENIELVTILDPALGPIKADPGQIEQVIMNLAVNARDAMPLGGRLTIETANVVLDENYARQHMEVQPGPYVMLAVSDTGVGMDEETRSHIFEPFFTTKGVGQGTGLGLATVYGIVKQSGGHIRVYSEPGHGTTFKIYLPRIEEVVESGQRAPIPGESPPGRETILLVEDEALVRDLARRVLLQHGYTVLEARHGREALQICEQHRGPIHLLVTDVVMPLMNGRELAERLTTIHPEMKVLYISGYTGNIIIHHGLLEPGMAFLQKPFTPAALAHKVRQALDTSQQGDEDSTATTNANEWGEHVSET